MTEVKGESGVYNLYVPYPIKNVDFQRILRNKLNIPFGVSATK